ncbi:unnamed protein product [Parnassius mnemosyne]|uniref:Uncharacterized protein n=1 Tax=Parnassius mnemosyne TaxID=213953 RepID=A0AAV1KZD4_9NEOP
MIDNANWTDSPWEDVVLVSTAAVAFSIFTVFAVVSVVKQVQYHAVAKLQSSFKPSRHWGQGIPLRSIIHWRSVMSRNAICAERDTDVIWTSFPDTHVFFTCQIRAPKKLPLRIRDVQTLMTGYTLYVERNI